MQRVRILQLRGDCAAALQLLETLAPAFVYGSLLAQKRGWMKAQRARLLLALGRPDEALVDAEEGVAQEETFGQRSTIWRAHWTLARALNACKHLPEALWAFDRGIAALDERRTGTLGFRLDNLALRGPKPMVDEAIAYAVSADDAYRALVYSDAIKSRFLTRALLAGPPSSLDPEDAEDLDRLGAQIDPQISVYGDAPVGSDRFVAERAALVERIRLKTGAAPIVQQSSFNLEATFRHLHHDRGAALQLFLSGDVLTAVLLKDGEAKVRARELPIEIVNALGGFEENLSRPVQDQVENDYDPN